jgi:hypothetical protein
LGNLKLNLGSKHPDGNINPYAQQGSIHAGPQGRNELVNPRAV